MVFVVIIIITTTTPQTHLSPFCSGEVVVFWSCDIIAPLLVKDDPDSCMMAARHMQGAGMFSWILKPLSKLANSLAAPSCWIWPQWTESTAWDRTNASLVLGEHKGESACSMSIRTAALAGIAPTPGSCYSRRYHCFRKSESSGLQSFLQWVTFTKKIIQRVTKL